MNKVKRTQITTQITFDGCEITKYYWACANCGMIFLRRHDAQQCQHKSPTIDFSRIHQGKGPWTGEFQETR